MTLLSLRKKAFKAALQNGVNTAEMVRALKVRTNPYESDYRRMRGRIGKFNRTLSQVNSDHGVDFLKVVRELKRMYPGETIRVLDEGCGKSTFAEELEKEEGVKVTRSDMYDWKHPGDFHVVQVHRLARFFGKNRFHLVVSTRGGVDYCGPDKSVGLANIFYVLKPGCPAFVSDTTYHLLEPVKLLRIPHTSDSEENIVMFKPLSR